LTHKGDDGQATLVDFDQLWRNIAEVISAAPIIVAVFTAGALAALARMLTSRRYLDPISLTLLASFVAFAAYLLASSRHFYLHYMDASWALIGGILVLTVVEISRLFPAVSPRVIAGAAAMVGIIMISMTLLQTSRDAVKWVALNRTGAKLSKAVVTAGPSCANVSDAFVRAPENELYFGAISTLGTQQLEDEFSEAYLRAFNVPLLDHGFYSDMLTRNFHPFSYNELATEYPCIVVRTFRELNGGTSRGLLELHPEHCLVEGIQVYTIGIACEKIARAAQNE
jgi:hypothetical protein